MTQHFVLFDASERRWVEILENHADDAEALANRLVSEGTPTPEGCIVTDTTTVKKVQFNGQQFAAYRFIFCALNREVVGYDDVIRHRMKGKLRNTGCPENPLMAIWHCETSKHPRPRHVGDTFKY
jgi:hypothetical protein